MSYVDTASHAHRYFWPGKNCERGLAIRDTDGVSMEFLGVSNTAVRCGTAVLVIPLFRVRTPFPFCPDKLDS